MALVAGEISERVNDLCGQNYSEIVTLRMIDAGSASKNDVFCAFCTSPNNVLACLNLQAVELVRQAFENRL